VERRTASVVRTDRLTAIPILANYFSLWRQLSSYHMLFAACGSALCLSMPFAGSRNADAFCDWKV
jgi:hypothetical protein